ncbi:LPS translocon maturation chaperone LptM [Martelella alba]|uniref:Lipoprotein n=1 Tax=Martelella alba TaxID=2590451 RepID=A0ABY2SHL7_9HYPH|nr:lipoprotein [Martelella alba]TKI04173.1 hypothetical protein FCN80_19020 [Martelella alba]
MKSQLRPILLALLIMGLYGCGLKGPLYFPPPAKNAPDNHKTTLTSSDTSSQSPVQAANPGSDSRHSADSVVP